MNRRNIPNILTMSRVVLAIAFLAVLSFWRYETSPLAQGRSPDWVLVAAAALFLIAAATDAVDGHLARKWNVVSVFGRIMDPFADKLLVIGAFVFLAGPAFAAPSWTMYTPNGVEHVRHQMSYVVPWMVAAILGRELLVTSIRAAFEAKGVSFGASWSGKWKMILQSVCVPSVLILLNIGRSDNSSTFTDTVIQMLVYATVAVTAWSALPYIVRAIRVGGAGGSGAAP
jgi:CDP-diacylglycerol--glycerol-3-phosphate 3-phosphatidyltransferase